MAVKKRYKETKEHGTNLGELRKNGPCKNCMENSAKRKRKTRAQTKEKLHKSILWKRSFIKTEHTGKEPKREKEGLPREKKRNVPVATLCRQGNRAFVNVRKPERNWNEHTKGGSGTPKRHINEKEDRTGQAKETNFALGERRLLEKN